MILAIWLVLIVRFSLFVSFKGSNNQWTEPVDLGEKLNMGADQSRITPDGKYIFFIANGNSYWIDAGIIGDSNE